MVDEKENLGKFIKILKIIILGIFKNLRDNDMNNTHDVD
jgi:hypothetical protein